MIAPRSLDRHGATSSLAGAVVFVTWLLTWVIASSAHAQTPSAGSDEEIRIGMSAALSGPTQSLGRDMKRGIEAYFARKNRQGGVGGRPLRLIVLDDGYVPEVAARNMRRLIDEERVTAVIGNVGTPTAKETVPIAQEAGVLLFGAFTGAGFLRDESAGRYVINYRASYADETAEMIRQLLAAGIRPYEIAFFTQDDSYGQAGYEGALAALREHGFTATERLAHGRYERNTLAIEDGLITLIEADITPRAIIMIGTSAPCAALIHVIRRRLPHTLFLNVSFVDGMALAAELGDRGEGVIVTQVVPNFSDESLAIVRDYASDLAQIAPGSARSFVSLEGYITAKILVAGLERAAKPLTRESAVEGVLSLCEVDIGLGEGAGIDYCGNPRYAKKRVWSTMIAGGGFIPVDWSAVARQIRKWRR